MRMRMHGINGMREEWKGEEIGIKQERRKERKTNKLESNVEKEGLRKYEVR